MNKNKILRAGFLICIILTAAWSSRDTIPAAGQAEPSSQFEPTPFKPAATTDQQLAPQTACTTWKPVSLSAFGLGQGTEGSYSGGIFQGYSAEEGFEVTVFNNQMYLGMEADNTLGARLWRSKAGVLTPQSQDDWEEVVTLPNGYPFGVPNPTHADHIDSVESFNGQIYASIANRTGSVLGTGVFRSASGDPGTWSDALVTQVSSEGARLNDLTNQNFKDMQVFQNHLCGGSSNAAVGAQVWCTADGTYWEQKSPSGFGNVLNIAIWSGAVFNNQLFFGVQDTGESHGITTDDVARLYKTSDISGTPTWTPVFTGTAGSLRVDILGVFQNYLYIAHKSPSGIIILRSPSGEANTWVQANQPGMTAGHAANTNIVVDGSVVFNNELYLVVSNATSGAEVWKTADGTTWSEVGANGMGDSRNFTAELVVFNNALYAWTSNYLTGQQILRLDCSSPPLQTSSIITVGSTPGTCTSLSDAIRAANLGATINGCTGSNNDDMIKLARSIVITTTLPAITSTILLDGAGYALTSAGGLPFSLFTVAQTGYLQAFNLAVNGFTAPSGAVLVNHGYAELKRALITANTASGGGGVIDNQGNLRINQSILSGNQAAEGGALLNNGEVNIFASTIVSNSASLEGGAIANLITGAHTIHMKDTILGNNSAPSGPDCLGGIYSQDYNLIENASGCTLSGLTGNTVTGADPQILPLARNNNTTFSFGSHALQTGSPAIDAVPVENCPAQDFRYQFHNIDYPAQGSSAALCDIGAFELQVPETSQETINQNIVDFGAVMVTIRDNAPIGGSHPGLTTVRRYPYVPVGITGTAGELPFYVQIIPTVNTALDTSLTICYTAWDAANINYHAQDLALIARPSLAPMAANPVLSLYRQNPSTGLWTKYLPDAINGRCLTVNQVTAFSNWALAADATNQVSLNLFNLTDTAAHQLAIRLLLAVLTLIAILLALAVLQRIKNGLTL